MPFRYKIIHEKKTTFVQGYDLIDLKSSLQAMTDITSRDDYNPDYRAIVDLRKSDYNPSMLELFTLRDSIVSLRHRINNDVIVITRKERVNQMNMIAFLAKVYNMQMHVVSEMNELEELEKHL